MKKAKLLLATAAVATAITCAVGCSACGGNSADTRDKDIAAVYQRYVAYADASGETALTYEQWLETIKGDKGATGATGATGKSAYEIAKDNGFEGTEAEWLESLKGANGAAGAAGAAGANGSAGAAGKSAYEIAKDNGFEGTEQEWLESLKCANGDIYKDSDGELVIVLKDGTIKPVTNLATPKQLLVVGENYIKVGTEETTKLRDAGVTEVSFITFTKGTYKFTLYDDNASLYVGDPNVSFDALIDIESGPDGNVINPGSFGINPDDGSCYNILSFDEEHSLFLANWGTEEANFRLTIERVD